MTSLNFSSQSSISIFLPTSKCIILGWPLNSLSSLSLISAKVSLMELRNCPFWVPPIPYCASNSVMVAWIISLLFTSSVLVFNKSKISVKNFLFSAAIFVPSSLWASFAKFSLMLLLMVSTNMSITSGLSLRNSSNNLDISDATSGTVPVSSVDNNFSVSMGVSILDKEKFINSLFAISNPPLTFSLPINGISILIPV